MEWNTLKLFSCIDFNPYSGGSVNKGFLRLLLHLRYIRKPWTDDKTRWAFVRGKWLACMFESHPVPRSTVRILTQQRTTTTLLYHSDLILGHKHTTPHKQNTPLTHLLLLLLAYMNPEISRVTSPLIQKINLLIPCGIQFWYSAHASLSCYCFYLLKNNCCITDLREGGMDY